MQGREENEENQDIDPEIERDMVNNVLESLLHQDEKPSTSDEEQAEDSAEGDGARPHTGDDSVEHDDSTDKELGDEDEDTHKDTHTEKSSNVVKRVEDQAKRLEAIVQKGRSNESSPSVSTVFIRNIPVSATNDLLFSAMKRFGFVKSCRLVMNKKTGLPKGTAFVDFKGQDGAEAATEACKKCREKRGPPVLVGGMPVEIDHALDGKSIKELAVGKQLDLKPQDRRNQYLAKEGLIQEGSVAWNQLSTSDQAKRRRAMEESSLKLRSPNFAVSKTRLNVRNIPKHYDEKQLKKLFAEAVKRRATKENPKIVQVKILREQSSEEGKLGSSKGIAFVEFSQHAHSLCALRELNNNPTIWGKDHRPIVEFAIDNVQALKIRAAKLEKQKSSVAPSSHEATKENKPREKRKSDAHDEEDKSKSKRKLRLERRAMLKQRARAEKNSTGNPDDSTHLLKNQNGSALSTKSQRRREQRKRKQGNGSKDLVAAGIKERQPPKAKPVPPITKPTSHTKVKFPLDILAESSIPTNMMVQKKKRKSRNDMDSVEELASKHIKRTYQRADPGRQKKKTSTASTTTGSPKDRDDSAKKRWFE